MNVGAIALLFLLISGVAVSALCQRYVSSNIKASILSGVLCSAVFQLTGLLYTGHLDPFFPIALLISFLLVFIISYLIGRSIFKK